MKVDVLGVKYTVKMVNFGQDEYMDKMNFCGYTNNNAKIICILNLKSVDEWKNEAEEIVAAQQKETLRHELIHAFLSESGLRWNSFSAEKAWAQNEEMVDWFAIQFPKMIKVFRDAECL